MGPPFSLRPTPLGVGGDEVEPRGVDLAEHGPAFVVAGPAGSGRSTTLATVVLWLGHQGVPLVLLADRRSPLRGLVGEPGVQACLGCDDAADLTSLLATCRGPVVVADDAERLHDTPVEGPLLSLLGSRSEGAAPLVIAGSTAEMAAAFRGLTVEARRSRCGLLLGATSPADGDLFGVRVPRATEAPPGRGLLVVRGRLEPVQVAVSEPR